MKDILFIILFLLAMVLALREVYLDFSIKRFTKFNLKSFLSALLVYLIFFVVAHLLFGDFVRWVLE